MSTEHNVTNVAPETEEPGQETGATATEAQPKRASRRKTGDKKPESVAAADTGQETGATATEAQPKRASRRKTASSTNNGNDKSDASVLIEGYVGQQKADPLAERRAVWDAIKKAHRTGTVLQRPVLYVTDDQSQAYVDIGAGILGVIPRDQFDPRADNPKFRLSGFVGHLIGFKVIGYDENIAADRVACSRIAYLAESGGVTWDTLEAGQVRAGVVKRIERHGAYVDLGGVVGFLAINDLDHGYVYSVDEVVRVGEYLDVMVLDVDKERQRVRLGRKQLIPDALQRLLSFLRPGGAFAGTVTYITTNLGAAFVEVEPGVVVRARIPAKITVELGDRVQGIVRRIEPDRRRITGIVTSTVPKLNAPPLIASGVPANGR